MKTLIKKTLLASAVVLAFTSSSFAMLAGPNQCEIYIVTYNFSGGGSLQHVVRNCNGTEQVLHTLEQGDTSGIIY